MHTHHEFGSKQLTTSDATSHEPRTTLAGLRVFVAEDEPILLWALEDVLDSFGCTLVGSARSVTDALLFVAENTFDVAILDGTLSDGGIAPVVEFLTARRVPFVVVSGSSSAELSKLFADTICIRKPYSDVKLRDALLSVLAK